MQNFGFATGNSCVVDTMSIRQVKTKKKIAEYIRNQLKEDAEASQLTPDLDPFT